MSHNPDVTVDCGVTLVAGRAGDHRKTLAESLRLHHHRWSYRT